MKKVFALMALVMFATGMAHAELGYHYEHLGLEKAHELTLGSGEVTVAILNTGLNYRLEEFNGKVELDPNNGSYGYDAVNNTFDPLDALGIGTQEASLVVGATLGVAPGARVVPVRIFSDNGSSSELIIAKGIDYAISRRVEIILMAIGVGQPSRVICDALKKAAEANILVVAAAGNYGTELSDQDYPVICGVDNVIVVTASNEERALAPYSSYGFRNVHTAAPGERIPGMDHTGAIIEGRGTSMSAALAAGVAALVLSHNPTYSPLQLKEALIRGADRNAALQGKVTSNGVLNAHKAMTTQLD